MFIDYSCLWWSGNNVTNTFLTAFVHAVLRSWTRKLFLVVPKAQSFLTAVVLCVPSLPLDQDHLLRLPTLLPLWILTLQEFLHTLWFPVTEHRPGTSLFSTLLTVSHLSISCITGPLKGRSFPFLSPHSAFTELGKDLEYLLHGTKQSQCFPPILSIQTEPQWSMATWWRKVSRCLSQKYRKQVKTLEIPTR